ncbi:hypothetical protein Q2E61_09305 [Microbulbifer thermotolerans]|uniref:hypothetical protein n=1 Tax=Microbulbifer thermotolerans TaxID=252514 RepID=UPI0026732C2D|nr:hypothetical protein [Microbulbifer thermotolerans]WKT59124.1 hypothetical protein Q2E61_09305 [Microbulbifer thermotolerans]
MQGENWIQEALRDWGRRHRGEPGAELGHRRQTNFAHHIRDRFDTDDACDPALPVSDLSMEVDQAVAFLRARSAEEGRVLEMVYLQRLPVRKACAVLGVNNNQLTNLRSTAERTVEMYLTMRCNRSAADFNPSLLLSA